MIKSRSPTTRCGCKQALGDLVTEGKPVLGYPMPKSNKRSWQHGSQEHKRPGTQGSHRKQKNPFWWTSGPPGAHIARKINPAYEQIAEEYAGRLEVVKVDVDQDETLWEELELIPTLRLYMEGKPVDSIVRAAGPRPRSRHSWRVLCPKEKKATRKAPVRHDHHWRRPRRIYRGAVRSQSGP